MSGETPGENRRRVVRSWPWLAAAAGYTVLIYCLLPVARKVWALVEPLLGRDVSTSIVLVGAVLVGLLALRAWFAGEVRRAAGVLVLFACLVAYATILATMYAGRVTVEKVHLIEYGLLGYLVTNALDVSFETRRGTILVAAWLLLAGIGDELVQAFLPDRVFDLLDIAGNWLGAALGLVAWAAASRNSPWRRSRP